MPFSPQELQDIEQLLRRRRAAVAAELRSETRGEDGLLALPSHRGEGDRGADFEMEAVDLAQGLRDAAEIQRIDAALQRLRDGGYGTCEDCGEEISPQRLRAEPEALRCAACQMRFERSHPQA